VTKQKNQDGRDVDLFGAPVGQLRERWGRPQFKKDKHNQSLVAALRAAGWTQVRIAGYLGCDEKTLRKNFSRELAAGSDMIEGQAIEVMVQKMREGRAWATDRVLEMCAENAAMALGDAKAEQEAEEKAPALGKKATLDRDAQQPTGGWGKLIN
jgi:lambda repressor-like predicted transcriptional regulator